MNKVLSFASLINLQRFANPNTQTTLLPGLSDEMKTYYSDYLIDMVESKLVHDQFADKRDIPQNAGKEIEFRKYSPLPKALTPLTEGVTPDGNSLNVSVVTARIHQYGDYVTLSDILQLTAIDNNVVQATKLLASQAGRTLDTITREVMAGGTNVIYAEETEGAGEPQGRQYLTKANKFTPDTAFKAKTRLAAANTAPIDDSYVAIVHPYVAYDIMRNKEWIDVKNYDNKDYYNGEIGKLGGIRFVETTEAKILYGEDLSEASRTLTIASTSGATITVNEAVTESIVGRTVIIADRYYKVTNVASKVLTLGSIIAGESVTSVTGATSGTKVYPGEGGKDGCALFNVMVVGANAYATTSLKGAGLEHIVKPLGSAGTADPLNQRSTVGWKATKAAERLVEDYMVRVECGSSYSDKIKTAN